MLLSKSEGRENILTVLYIFIETNLHLRGLIQFKPLFKVQLYIQLFFEEFCYKKEQGNGRVVGRESEAKKVPFLFIKKIFFN